MEGKIRVVSEHDTGSCGLSAIVLMQMPSAWQVKTSCWAVLENMPVWPDHCIMQRHCPSSQVFNSGNHSSRQTERTCTCLRQAFGKKFRICTKHAG